MTALHKKQYQLNDFDDQLLSSESRVEMLNPFVHRLEINQIDKIQTAILTVLLLPIRVFVICILLILAWILACIGLSGLSMHDLQTKPMTGWRRQCRNVTSKVMRAMFFIGSFHYVKITGVQASPKVAPILVVAPHSSFFDSIVAIVAINFGPPAAVAKAETAMLPFFGTIKYVISMIGRWSYLAGGMAISVKGQQASRKEAAVLVIAPHSTFLDSVIVYVTNMCSVIVRTESMDNYVGKLINYTQPIYVWRDDPNSRQNTIKNIIERANSQDDWPQIIIFPEGTCTNRSCLITFKAGAFYPGVPIQPVCIRYPNKLDTVTWTWEGPGVLKLLWLTLSQIHSTCEIEFLPVYVPNAEEKENPKLFADNVRDVMAKALGVPVSDYNYDDCKVMTRAKQMNIPFAADIVDIEKLRRKLGLDKTNIEEHITRSSLVNDINCYVTIKEFATKLQITAEDLQTVKLFTLFDKENIGKIDFRKYLLCALFIINTEVPVIHLLEMVSMMYESKPGQFSCEALHHFISNTVVTPHGFSIKVLFAQIYKENRHFITFNEFRNYLRTLPEFAYIFQLPNKICADNTPKIKQQ